MNYDKFFMQGVSIEIGQIHTSLSKRTEQTFGNREQKEEMISADVAGTMENETKKKYKILEKKDYYFLP